MAMNNTNYSQNNTELKYKDHTGFFTEFLEMRSKTFILLSGVLTNDKLIPDLFQAIDTLVNYTSCYIHNFEEIEEELAKVSDIILKTKNGRTAIPMLRKILIRVNKSHMASEIIPQTVVNVDMYDSIWKEEENRSLREIKKIIVDLLK